MRLYYGGYGHHPSGKQYAYFGNDNYRTGQNVAVQVTNRWTGNPYNTMFTIMRTSGVESPMAEGEAQRLSQNGIDIKEIIGTDVSSLSGSEKYKNRLGQANKSAWARESEKKYQSRINERLLSRGGDFNNGQAQQRILGG